MKNHSARTQYEAMNPIGELAAMPESGHIQPRLRTLEGKTIGLFDNAKRPNPYVFSRIERLLKERFPSVNTSWFEKQSYKEVLWDQEKEWAQGLDGVIGMFGD